MIRRFTCILLCVLLVCGTGLTVAQAADEVLSGTCGENLTWTLSDGTLTISGTGDMEDYCAAGLAYIPEYMPPVEPWYAQKENVRSIVVEEGVTGIGDGAFQYCSNAESVTLPQTLTAIGVSAFAFCANLDVIRIPQSVTGISRYAFRRCGRVLADADNAVYTGGEDGILFSKDHTHLLHYPINLQQTTYRIPDSVRTVEEYAFDGCRYLLSVTVPASLENNAFAFSYCTSLQSANVEAGVKAIGSCAFFGCRNLRTVTLPDGLESIESLAFSDTALECLHIPSSVTRISRWILFFADKQDDDTLPYMQQFYICSDTENCAAREYADANQFRFYVCNKTHDERTVHFYNGMIQRIVYVLRDGGRTKELTTALLSALFVYVGTLLKRIHVSQSFAG